MAWDGTKFSPFETSNECLDEKRDQTHESPAGTAVGYGPFAGG